MSVTITAGVSVSPMGVMKVGGDMINGVVVIIAGVIEGMGDWTGKGCGATANASQDVRIRARKAVSASFLIKRIILPDETSYLKEFIV